MEIIGYYLAQIFTWKGVKAFFSAIGLLLSWLFGGVDQVWMALLALLVLDYVLGFAYAVKTNNILGEKLRHWGGKFITYGMAIIVGNLLDLLFFHKSQVDFGWRNACIVYLGVNEALSVCKHLINFGVPFPEKMIQKLESYKADMWGNAKMRRKDDHDANS